MPDDLPPWLLDLRRRVGANLRRERMARGWSQEQLGERAGVDRRTVGGVELGNRSPRLDHLALLAHALGVPSGRWLTDRGKRGSASAAATGAAGGPAPHAADADTPEQDRAAVRRRRRARANAAGLGRSRGGLSSKIHAAVDAAGLPLSLVLTPGQAADCPQFPTVLGKIRIPGPVGRPRTRPDAVAADKAYSSRANRAYLRRRRISAAIPEKTDQQANRRKKDSAGGRPVAYDPERYKQRNTVERCFQKIKT